MFSPTSTYVLPGRDKGSDKPSATIEPNRIMVPSKISTWAAGLKVKCRNNYSTTAHKEGKIGKPSDDFRKHGWAEFKK